MTRDRRAQPAGRTVEQYAASLLAAGRPATVLLSELAQRIDATAMPTATAATAATGSDGRSPFRARPACSTWRSASTCRCCAANGRVHDTSWRRTGARTETAGRLHGYLGEVPPDLSITIHVDLGDYECYGIVHTACIGVERDQSMTQRLSATEYVPPGLTKTKRRCENPCAGGGSDRRSYRTFPHHRHCPEKEN